MEDVNKCRQSPSIRAWATPRINSTKLSTGLRIVWTHNSKPSTMKRSSHVIASTCRTGNTSAGNTCVTCLWNCGEGPVLKMSESGRPIGIESYFFPLPPSPDRASSLCVFETLRVMVNVTYNILETGPPAIYSGGLSVLLLTVLALPLIFPLILRKNLEDKHGHPIPPGPPIRYPFLRRHAERSLRAWSLTYGPLFSLWMGNQLFVVISDARIAKDLLVSNSSIFSSRKQYFIKCQTILRGRGITVTPYNDKW